MTYSAATIYDEVAYVAFHFGWSREEILDRLSKNLPDAVDRYTPDGQVPPRGFDPAI